MNRKNFLKNKKINWIKVVIQILSFALIPGLFEGEFAAVGNIVSCIYKGNISWESVKYSVWMLVATVPATVLVGRFFCSFFILLRASLKKTLIQVFDCKQHRIFSRRPFLY